MQPGYLTQLVTKKANTEIDFRPNDPLHGALAGGGVGALLGAGTGVVQALRKKKTLMQALTDTLEDAAIGGAGGAALGGLSSALHRELDVSKVRDQIPPGTLGMTDANIRSGATEHRIPLVASLQHLLGRTDDAAYDKAKEISKMHGMQGVTAKNIDPETVYDADREMQKYEEAQRYRQKYEDAQRNRPNLPGFLKSQLGG